MSFSFRRDELLAKGIRRILRSELSHIQTELTAPEGRHKAIHEARKRHKKVRAILRLVRFSITEKRYREENNFYRDQARKMSAIRDATALIEALEALENRFPGEIPARSLQALHKKLDEKRDRAAFEVIEEKRVMEEVAVEIAQQQARTLELQLSGDSFFLIISGLREVYRKGYKRLHASLKYPDMEHIHDWRKRVKYLWYHLLLLTPCWPPVMEALAGELKLLSDWLGDWRDLGLLKDSLNEDPHLKPSDSILHKTNALIDAYREELLTDSFSLGRKIYREKPRPFSYRLQGYYKSWKNQDQTETHYVGK